VRFIEFKLNEAFDPDVAKDQKVLNLMGYQAGTDGEETPAFNDAVKKFIAAFKAGKVDKKKYKDAYKSIIGGGSSGTSSGKTRLPVNARVTQAYGNVSGRGTHGGVDLGAPQGTPIAAPQDGVITTATMNGNTCGGMIVLQSGNVMHKFCHCSSINSRVGQEVRAGDIVAYSGGTKGTPGAGFTTGPHLHWEKYVAGRAVDPMTA
jgi:hypothetical protein